MATIKLTLRRVRINKQGYDASGAYWGVDQPLYWAGSDDGRIDIFLRAPNRYFAKHALRAKFQANQLSFYN